MLSCAPDGRLSPAAARTLTDEIRAGVIQGIIQAMRDARR
jgi:hypothetical protein